MITELTDLPAGIIGFEASGKLEAEDYRDVPAPGGRAGLGQWRRPNGARHQQTSTG